MSHIPAQLLPRQALVLSRKEWVKWALVELLNLKFSLSSLPHVVLF
jgi:hypothetical protein